jgi:hypothetical protein
METALIRLKGSDGLYRRAGVQELFHVLEDDFS